MNDQKFAYRSSFSAFKRLSNATNNYIAQIFSVAFYVHELLCGTVCTLYAFFEYMNRVSRVESSESCETDLGAFRACIKKITKADQATN